MKNKVQTAVLGALMASTSVGAAHAQDVTLQNPPVSVAIVDSQVTQLDFDDPNVRFVDMTPAAPAGSSFVKSKVTDRYSHGDIVASSFVREYRKLEPTRPIVVYSVDPFIRREGEERSGFSMKMLNEAMPKLRAAGVTVAVTAFGVEDQEAGQRIADAFSRNGISLFAAVPNDRNDRGIFPAASQGVISVASETAGGAFDKDRKLATWVSLSISGVHASPHNMSDANGTSFASPKAAAYGVYIKDRRPEMSSQDLRREIMVRGLQVGGVADGRQRITARIGREDMISAVVRDFPILRESDRIHNSEGLPSPVLAVRNGPAGIAGTLASNGSGFGR